MYIWERVADKSICAVLLLAIDLVLEWSGDPNLMWWNIGHQLISQVSCIQIHYPLFSVKTQQGKIVYKCPENKFWVIKNKL